MANWQKLEPFVQSMWVYTEGAGLSAVDGF